MQGLGRDQVLFTWMMLPVMEQRIPCWTVTVLCGARATVHTMKTQGSYVTLQMRYQLMISTNFPLVKIWMLKFSVVKMGILFSHVTINMPIQKGLATWLERIWVSDCGKRPMEDVINSRRKRDTGERTVEDWRSPLKIFGGLNADYGMFPWQVAIRKVIYRTKTRKIDAQHCGGIILSRFWILSAAHCFDE